MHRDGGLFLYLRRNVFGKMRRIFDSSLCLPMNPNNGDNEFSYLIDLDKKQLQVTSHRKRRVLTLRLDDESTICNLECRMIDFEDELEDY